MYVFSDVFPGNLYIDLAGPPRWSSGKPRTYQGARYRYYKGRFCDLEPPQGTLAGGNLKRRVRLEWICTIRHESTREEDAELFSR